MQRNPYWIYKDVYSDTGTVWLLKVEKFASHLICYVAADPFVLVIQILTALGLKYQLKDLICLIPLPVGP